MNTQSYSAPREADDAVVLPRHLRGHLLATSESIDTFRRSHLWLILLCLRQVLIACHI
jgi:hypothetical protein